MGWTAQRKTGQRICRLDEAIRAAKENTLVNLKFAKIVFSF